MRYCHFRVCYPKFQLINKELYCRFSTFVKEQFEIIPWVNCKTMNLITVDTDKCIRCGICADVCPVSVISVGEDQMPFVALENEKRCVLCGHCESFCNSFALKHRLLPETQTVQADRLREITPANMTEYFRSRRSVRTFLHKKVNPAVLKEVFEIVNYSPTGINQQMNRWVVVSNPTIIQQLAEAVILWMKALVQAESDMAIRLNCAGLIAKYEQGKDVICRNAPCLVIGYTDATYGGGTIDAVIATAQLEILFPTFGIGACWAGYLMRALRVSPDIQKIIGLNDSYTVHSVLMIGYPKYRLAKIPYRNAPQVRWM